MNAPIKNFSDMQKFSRSLRRTGATAIIHSGGKRTIFGCLCGATHTASTEWNGRNAKHVTDWIQQHEASCRTRFTRALYRRTDAWMSVQRDAVYSDDTH